MNIRDSPFHMNEQRLLKVLHLGNERLRALKMHNECEPCSEGCGRTDALVASGVAVPTGTRRGRTTGLLPPPASEDRAYYEARRWHHRQYTGA